MRHLFPKCGCAVLLLLLAAPVCVPRDQRSFQWPDVEPVHRDYKFMSADKANVNLPILGLNGKPLYRFRCVPDFPHENGTIGALGCYLISIASPDDELDSPSLLTENPLDGMVGHTRGEFSVFALENACADYPEHGSRRTFRLRRMKVSISIYDVEMIDIINHQIPSQTTKAIRAFGVSVTVTPDATALSAIAERVPYAPPKAKNALDAWNPLPDCHTVIPAHVPGEMTQAFVLQHGLAGPFPQIVPMERSVLLVASDLQLFDFAFPGDLMPPKSRMISFAILSSDGNRAYDFACSGYTTGGRFERYGIVCGLFLPEKEFNLLEPGFDPYSRMNPDQILPDQLCGDCGNYPGWGIRREFGLRGMKLIMYLSDPVFVTGTFGDRALSSVRLKVRVEPDPSTASPFASPPSTIYWGAGGGPDSCRTVLVASAQSVH